MKTILCKYKARSLMKVCKLRKLMKTLIIAIKEDPKVKRISADNFCSLFSFVFKFDKRKK